MATMKSPSALVPEDLRFDEDWGIRVQSVDPLPGQPGLAEGDFIVAIDGALCRLAGLVRGQILSTKPILN